MAETRKLLPPVDAERNYPQWGYLDTADGLIKFESDRTSRSIKYRETHGNFKQDADYEIEITLPGFPDPFVSRSKGIELAPDDAQGFPTERQANYPFAMIGQLPIYYEIVPG